MLFTSGAPGEGKTTTAVNTAVSLTKLGSKVLIIDCDLRRPTIHRQLGISSAKGVTNYLSSSEFKLEDLIQELTIPNLFAMTSGPIPPNPTELLSSQKMREMLEKLYDDFDHIIIDAPPVISVVDPIILSTIVEGTVFVINSGKTTRYILQRSTQKLSAVNSKVLGAVLNNVDLHKDGYSYYHYNYYQSNENKNA
jgi:capsular exopolysaccharide synthesis family protein